MDCEFKLPIQYVKNKILNDTIIQDLEIYKSYSNIFKDSILNEEWGKYYSIDKSFLKQTQKLTLKYKSNEYDIKEFYNIHSNFINEKNFLDKYQYINFERIKYLNSSVIFMQFLSYYNISSPILSLCSTIFVFIVPFFVLKLKNVPIEIDKYVELIRDLVSNHSMFKIFDKDVNYNQKISGIMSILFYFFQIYQNTISCISFYKNINHIGNFINNYRTFCNKSISLIDNVNNNCKEFSKYSQFYSSNLNIKNTFNDILKKFSLILPYENTLSRITQIGLIMTVYHELYHNKIYHDSIEYINKLNTFNNDVITLKQFVINKQLNKCRYKNDTSIEKMYYLPHINTEMVKNDLKINNNIILTGPNASGKTTIIKSLLMNIIMSQQFGFGCYKSANIKIYDYFHSYLNIPDTSDRDSLFQAEARRCKDILEYITKNNEKKHFCIFDEIYSGTNPLDATLCAEIYLKGLSQFKNLDFILTTHYIDVCKYFENNKKYKNIKNYKMNVLIENDVINYNYLIEPGISHVNGGKQILKDLEYPDYLFNL